MKKIVRLTESDLIKIVEQILNEDFETNLDLSKIVEDEIRVYRDTLKKLLNFVGEGIDDIIAVSEPMSGKWSKIKTDEIQNEITITFTENPWGGISMEEWRKAEDKLNEFVGKGGFNFFSINSSENKITLEFDWKHPMGLY